MANVPISNMTTTWTDSGTTYSGVKLNATDTASASGSLLMDLQVGGASKFKVEKDGTVTAGSGAASDFFAKGNGFSVGIPGNVSATLSGNLRLRGGLVISWNDGTTSAPGSNVDLILARDAANTLAQRNSTNAQTFRIYNTYTDASNYERGKIAWDSNVLKIGTEKGGTGTARAMELQTDGTTRLTISSTGLATFSGSVQILDSGYFQFGTTRAALRSPANGRITLLNSSESDFERLMFGGTTSSFPALKRSSTTLQGRLADDSAFCEIQGKLTTDTAYSAGAPTATGYIVLYDSTGTAYKVPAEAL